MTCLLLPFYMDLILFLGYLRLFLLLCLVVLFFRFLFHTFFFFLAPVFIYLILMRLVYLFPEPSYSLFCFYFFLILSHLHRVFSILFSLPSYHLSFLYFSKASSLPCLVLFLQHFFLRASLFSLSVLSFSFFVICICPRLIFSPFSVFVSVFSI